jgi:hypothetical protein
VGAEEVAHPRPRLRPRERERGQRSVATGERHEKSAHPR